MIIKFLGQSGYLLKTENSEIIIDPYLFAENIDGGFIMEFDCEYRLDTCGFCLVNF